MPTNFINALKTLDGLQEYPSRHETDRELIERIELNNSKLREAYISSQFDGRNTSSNVSNSFWVYCDTLEDAKKIKDKASAIGFINMRTFEPHTGTKEKPDEKLPDPKGAYAVDISASTELLIGDAARKLDKILSVFYSPLSEHVVFRYGHMRNYKICFNDESAAESFHLVMEQVLESFSKKVDVSYTLNMEKTEIDRWSVFIRLKTLHSLD